MGYAMGMDGLVAAWLEMPLGPMVVMAGEAELYLLEFAGRRKLDSEMNRLEKKMATRAVIGRTAAIDSIEKELRLYFEGKLTQFITPMRFFGTPFQTQVWKALMQIPYGETRSYAEIAIAIGRPSAYRAVAQANGANQCAVIVPCHRVINTSGQLGGYAAGLKYKKWLLHHEQLLKSEKK